MLYNLSGEKQNIARMAGIVPVMQQWHKKKVSLIMDENYEKRVTLNVQLDLKILFKLFFWSSLYSTRGSLAYTQTSTELKSENFLMLT